MQVGRGEGDIVLMNAVGRGEGDIVLMNAVGSGRGGYSSDECSGERERGI